MNPKKSAEWTVRSVAASLGGAAIGVYTGFNLLIPGAVAAGTWFLGSKFVRPTKPPQLPAMAFLAGHFAWVLVGTALTGTWGASAIDIAVMFGLLIWLWFWPGLTAIVVLTIFEALAFAVNCMSMLDQPVGSSTHRALVLHVALRCATVFSAWQAHLAAKRHADV